MVAYELTCAKHVSNYHDTTLTHSFMFIRHVLALKIEISEGDSVLQSNTEHIEHAFCTKTCLSLALYLDAYIA